MAPTSDYYDEFIGFKASGPPEDKYKIGAVRNGRKIFRRWTWVIMYNSAPMFTGNAWSEKAAFKAALMVLTALDKF